MNKNNPGARPIVSQIAAMSSNRVIGINGKLPWHLPEDLKFFRNKTKGRICLMGRKTFESVGSKPLPHRLNIVVSRKMTSGTPQIISESEPKIVNEDPVFCSDPEMALKWAMNVAIRDPEKWGHEIFVIGGAEIYRNLLPKTDRIYLTRIDLEIDGDAFFPELPKGDWEQVECEARHDPMNFEFLTFEKVKAGSK